MSYFCMVFSTMFLTLRPNKTSKTFKIVFFANLPDYCTSLNTHKRIFLVYVCLFIPCMGGVFFTGSAARLIQFISCNVCGSVWMETSGQRGYCKNFKTKKSFFGRFWQYFLNLLLAHSLTKIWQSFRNFMWNFSQLNYCQQQKNPISYPGGFLSELWRNHLRAMMDSFHSNDR